MPIPGTDSGVVRTIGTSIAAVVDIHPDIRCTATLPSAKDMHMAWTLNKDHPTFCVDGPWLENSHCSYRCLVGDCKSWRQKIHR
jgi:hypothetical protein